MLWQLVQVLVLNSNNKALLGSNESVFDDGRMSNGIDADALEGITKCGCVGGYGEIARLRVVRRERDPG